MQLSEEILSDMVNVINRRLQHLRDRIGVSRDPVGWARRQGVRVGERSRFIGVGIETFGSEPYLVSLGDDCTVTAGVRFITHDGGAHVARSVRPQLDVVAPIVLGDRVFVGMEAVFMPGVTVGDNVVVGARSVVTRDVPSGTVVAGMPAKPVSDIDTYVERLTARGDDTFGMSPREKRRFYEDKYGL